MNFLKKLISPSSVKTKIIFIVEDNPAYAKTLEAFLKNKFSDVKEIKVFPVGEVCLMEIHRNPTVVIMDYFLDTKYADAETGLEIIQKIKAQKPQTNIIILSSQKALDVTHEAVKKYDCNYVNKDESAFSKVEALIRQMW
ncbi:MAG TPA: response regulator [Bacteroidia bacterium]|jgi:ActR/RegA family two-component response regulator|nr:response regulator [Bacteroidia bacterium]